MARNYIILGIVLIILSGCKQIPPCVEMCIKENKNVVEEGFLDEEELYINCDVYCNSNADETRSYADGR